MDRATVIKYIPNIYTKRNLVECWKCKIEFIQDEEIVCRVGRTHGTVKRYHRHCFTDAHGVDLL